MIFDHAFTYWSWIGTLYLIILTYQDFKHNREIDDRKNWFMMGMSLSLISHFSRPIWYMIALILIIAVMNWCLKKYSGIGEGDINTLGWIFLGFGILNVFKLFFFVFFFIVLTLIYYFFKNIVFKRKEEYTQFYPVLLGAFWFSCWVMMLY